jgi:hypothetical protein
VLARLLGMPFNDFVSFRNAKVGVASRGTWFGMTTKARKTYYSKLAVLDGFNYHVGDGRLPLGKSGDRTHWHGDAK